MKGVAKVTQKSIPSLLQVLCGWLDSSLSFAEFECCEKKVLAVCSDLMLTCGARRCCSTIGDRDTLHRSAVDTDSLRELDPFPSS